VCCDYDFDGCHAVIHTGTRGDSPLSCNSLMSSAERKKTEDRVRTRVGFRVFYLLLLSIMYYYLETRQDLTCRVSGSTPI